MGAGARRATGAVRCARAPGVDRRAKGGLVDKPGKGRDYYHTCYVLSGLAQAQQSGLIAVARDEDRLAPADALLNVASERLERWNALQRRREGDSGAVVTAPRPPFLWKVATAADAQRWQSAGAILGSDLDASDGFFHFSDERMVREVCRRFFSGARDAVLLQVRAADLAGKGAGKRGEVECCASDAGAGASTAAAAVARLPDGCAHVYTGTEAGALRPIPFAAVAAVHALKLSEDGTSHVFPQALGPE